MAVRHSEFAFIPLNDGKSRKCKPWFAIACLRWTAKDARWAMTNDDPRVHTEAWRRLRKDGWQIVKVAIATAR